jgi:hypothetical protein
MESEGCQCRVRHERAAAITIQSRWKAHYYRIKYLKFMKAFRYLQPLLKAFAKRIILRNAKIRRLAASEQLRLKEEKARKAQQEEIDRKERVAREREENMRKDQERKEKMEREKQEREERLEREKREKQEKLGRFFCSGFSHDISQKCIFKFRTREEGKRGALRERKKGEGRED